MNRSDTLAAIAILVSIVSVLIGAVVGNNANDFASLANLTAAEANQIAREAHLGRFTSNYSNNFLDAPIGSIN